MTRQQRYRNVLPVSKDELAFGLFTGVNKTSRNVKTGIIQRLNYRFQKVVNLS